MSKLRVLLVSTSYPIRQGSISGIFVKNLVKSLTEYTLVTVVTPGDNYSNRSIHKDGQEDLVICNYAPSKWQSLAHNPGGIPARLKQKKLLVLTVPLLMLSICLNILAQAKKHDVIHCNWSITGFLAGLCRWFIKAPIVTTLRGEDVKKNSGMFSRLILRVCLSCSDKVVLVSNEMRHDLIQLYPQYQSKFETICNGVDEIFLNEHGAITSTRGGNSVIKIITVASLIPRKNIEFILSALAYCHKKGVKFEYVIIGDGEDLCKLKKMAEDTLIGSNVTFLGQLEPFFVAQELGNSSIFITASKHEGRPNVVIEAMASGLCVLASDISGHRELIKDTRVGLTFNLENIESLAELLCRLAESPDEIERLGVRARNYILASNLTWKSCAENYLNLFKSLLNEKSG